MLSYILHTTETPPEALRTWVHQLGPHAEEAWMTGAEMLRNEGEARGQLTDPFGPLSPADQTRVRSAPLTELEAGADLLLTATSLDELRF